MCWASFVLVLSTAFFAELNWASKNLTRFERFSLKFSMVFEWIWTENPIFGASSRVLLTMSIIEYFSFVVKIMFSRVFERAKRGLWLFRMNWKRSKLHSANSCKDFSDEVECSNSLIFMNFSEKWTLLLKAYNLKFSLQIALFPWTSTGLVLAEKSFEVKSIEYPAKPSENAFLISLSSIKFIETWTEK